MNWFLVLLFWNPAIQEFDIANGWAPLPMASEEVCVERGQYVIRYLPDQIPEDQKYVVACVKDDTPEKAANKLKATL